MRIISITPARGGSKGIPGKNMMPFAGKPLVGWTIAQSLAAESVSETIISSDGQEILDYASQQGAIALRRPDEISGDLASSESAVLHALDTRESRDTRTTRESRDTSNTRESHSKPVDLVVFLQATCPLRMPGDIDAAVKLLIDSGADSVFSSCPLESFFLWRQDGDELTSVNYDYRNRQRRQDMAPQYRENGSIFVFKPNIIRDFNNRLGGKIRTYPMQGWQAYDIDSREDVEICEHYFCKKGLDK